MKFFHVADVHLGAAPDVGCSWNKERKSDIWENFRRLIKLAKKQEIDLLLLAGDIFHGQPKVGEVKELNALLGQIPETEVVMIAGNHDYIKEKSSYLAIQWNPNVHGLWKKDIHRIYLPKLNAYVYGCSYHTKEITERLYDALDKVEKEKEAVHILLGHGGDKRHSPIDFKRLGMAGFDYVALGHIHKPQILSPNRIAYAGALESIDKNDEESHGFIAGKIEGKKVEVHQIPFAKWEYKKHIIEINPQMTQTDIEVYLQKLIKEYPLSIIWKIELRGKRDMDIIFDIKRLLFYGNIIEVKDESKVDFCLEDLKKTYQGTFIELYIRQFEKLPQSKVNKKALEYGLWAMLEARD